jgi:hypothetical protein
VGDWLRDRLDPKLRQLGGGAMVPETAIAEPRGSVTGDAPARGE